MHTLESFYRKDYEYLLNYAFKYTNDIHLAEDFVHNIFCNAIQKQIFTTHPNPSAWLMVSMQYEIKHYYRKKKPFLFNDLPSIPITEYEYLNIETDMLLRTVLTDIEYTIIEMVFIKGIKEADVSQELDIPYAALRVRIHRIKKKLQSIFFP